MRTPIVNNKVSAMRFSILHPGILLALILAVSLPVGGQAQVRQIKVRPTQIYTNGPSHFQFPPKIVEFQREPSISQFDRDGRDIGVGYNSLDHKIAATVFVYPIRHQPPDDTLEGHFGSCKAEVMHRHDDAKLVSEGKVQITPGGQKQDGLHATFTFTDMFAHERQPLRSESYLFTYQQSFVLYRFTFPSGQQGEAEPAIKGFVDGLAWP